MALTASDAETVRRDMTAPDPDWPALIARVHAGERAKDVAREAGVDGRRLRMKALHADPEFAAANRERNRERMKALHADPEFNPLVLLTEAERADYDTLKQAGYTRDDAFSAIGRLDLVQMVGADLK